MIGTNFAFEQDVTTVPSMTAYERDRAMHDINNEFDRFYRDNYFRFSAMYRGSITINGRDMTYDDMMPYPVNPSLRLTWPD